MPRLVLVVLLSGSLFLTGCQHPFWKKPEPNFIGSTADDKFTRWCENHRGVTNSTVILGLGTLLVVGAVVGGAAYLYCNSEEDDSTTTSKSKKH
jgi:hypothetical protein